MGHIEAYNLEYATCILRFGNLSLFDGNHLTWTIDNEMGHFLGTVMFEFITNKICRIRGYEDVGWGETK